MNFSKLSYTEIKNLACLTTPERFLFDDIFPIVFKRPQFEEENLFAPLEALKWKEILSPTDGKQHNLDERTVKRIIFLMNKIELSFLREVLNENKDNKEIEEIVLEKSMDLFIKTHYLNYFNYHQIFESKEILDLHISLLGEEKVLKSVDLLKELIEKATDGKNYEGIQDIKDFYCDVYDGTFIWEMIEKDFIYKNKDHNLSF